MFRACLSVCLPSAAWPPKGPDQCICGVDQGEQMASPASPQPPPCAWILDGVFSSPQLPCRPHAADTTAASFTNPRCCCWWLLSLANAVRRPRHPAPEAASCGHPNSRLGTQQGEFQRPQLNAVGPPPPCDEHRLLGHTLLLPLPLPLPPPRRDHTQPGRVPATLDLRDLH